MSTPAHGQAAALLASPVRRSLLDQLRRRREQHPDQPGLTAAALAPHVGLHLTTVRFHLDQLVGAGLAGHEFQRQEGAGRPRKLYFALPPDESTSAAEPLLLLATLLAEAMTASVDGHPETPEEAGRRWAREHLPSHGDRLPAESAGAWLGRVGNVIDVLDQWGYHPEVTTSDAGRSARVELADCPFLDLARANEAAVCGVHFGLIAQALEQSGETSAEVALTPFVTPRQCIAEIRSTATFRSA